jgi:MFS transporter, DHA1 family, arabinose polymer utilization protein
MTVANVVGVPFATFISNVLVWRYMFALVALFGLIAFLCIKFIVPYISPLPHSNIKGEFKFLRSSAPWLIYGGVFFAQAAVYCWLSYISPVMTNITGFTLPDMTWIMVLVGFGMVFGNFIAGKMATKHSPSLVSATIAGLMLIVLPALFFFSDIKFLSLLLAFVASACLFGVGGPPQYLIVGFSKGGEMLGAAGIQIAFNVSNATSAAIGGAAINYGLPYDSTALIGIPFSLIGMFCFLMLHRKYKTEGA